LQALFDLDFDAAVRFLPHPPSFDVASRQSDACAVIDSAAIDQLSMRFFAQHNLRDIVRECEASFRRAMLSSSGGERGGGPCSEVALKILVEKLVIWAQQAQELEWICESDARVHLKMLWGIISDAGNSIDESISPSAADPPSSLAQTSFSLLTPPSRLAAIHACLLAAAGDAPGLMNYKLYFHGAV
jgi:hypothetical protein